MSLDSKEKVVLVTGGSGYLGGWTVVGLLRQGYRVRTTVRSLGKEVDIRAAMASQVDPEDRLSLVAADLLGDDGWDRAADGCDYVLHVASPMGYGSSQGQDLVPPARDGTLRVLKAASKAGVERVVVTSSVVASTPSIEPKDETPGPTDESVWTDPSATSTDMYARSKTLAERAAWEFIEQCPGRTTLTTILPGCILGPVMPKAIAGSVEIISRMLAGKIPALPRIGFAVVDTRDLVDLHIKAMLAPEAAGQRFVAAGDFLWMADMARLLREILGPRAGKVPTRGMPDFVVRLAALFNYEARLIAPNLGRRREFSSAKAGRLLGWDQRPARETVLDCARSVLDTGLIRQDQTKR